MYLIRALFKILLWLLIVALCLGLIYVTYLFVRKYWMGALISAYYLIAFAFAALGIYNLNKAFVQPDKAHDPHFYLVSVLNRRAGFFQKLRRYFAAMMAVTADAVCWPSTFIIGIVATITQSKLSGISESRLLTMGAVRNLYSFEAYQWATNLAICLIFFGLRSLFGLDSLLLTLTFVNLIAFCILRLVSYIVNPSSLQENLRKQIHNPYLLFISIAFCIFAITLVSFASLLFPAHTVTFGNLYQLARDFVEYRKVWEVIQGHPLRVIDYFIVVSGLLFSIAIVQTLTQFGEFKRKDEDRQAMAFNFLNLGKFNTALECLKKCNPNDKNTLDVLAYCYLGVNRIDKVVETVKRSQAISNPMGISLDMTLIFLLNTAHILPIPKTAVLSLITEIKAMSPTPWLLDASLMMLIISEVIEAHDIRSIFTETELALYPSIFHYLNVKSRRQVAEAAQYVSDFVPVSGTQAIGFVFLTSALLNEQVLEPETRLLLMMRSVESLVDFVSGKKTPFAQENEKYIAVSILSNFANNVIKEIVPDRYEEFVFSLGEMTNSFPEEARKFLIEVDRSG